MWRIVAILIVVLCWCAVGPLAPVIAQTTDVEATSTAPAARELETDRDAFTPATSVVGKRLIVVESSYSFIDNRNVADTNSLPELLVRYGISERIELRFGWNYEVGGAEDVSGNDSAEPENGSGRERESQLLYGLKMAVTEQSGWVPRSVAILQGFTPTFGPAPATDVVIDYAAGWEFTNGWEFDSSIRYGTEHGPADAFNQWAPSTVLRIPLTERWAVHAEYFGIFSQGAARDFSHAFFSPGTHYLLTPNLELGVRIGWGITADAAPFFSNVGVGWRF